MHIPGCRTPRPRILKTASYEGSMSIERKVRSRRGDYRVFPPIPTRWMDNDAYGHVNNVVYHSWFDTAVNTYLSEAGVLDIGASPTVGVVIETGCTYFESVTYPETIEAGLAVTKLARSSVTYGGGIFKQGGAFAAPQGPFVHVYFERATQRPIGIPGEVRTKLEALVPEP